MKIQHDNGFRTRDLASIDDYDEYKAMGESFNIYSLPIAKWSTGTRLEESAARSED